MTVLDRLEQLRTEATPGPWIQGDDASGVSAFGIWRGRWFGLIARTDTGEPNAENAALIVAAVNALPALLRIARAAEAFADGLVCLDPECIHSVCVLNRALSDLEANT